MKIKLELRGKTVICLGWIHLFFLALVLFGGFIMLVAGVLSL